MKRTIANGFKKHYDEQYTDYDILDTDINGYRCVKVFVGCNSSENKYNLLDKKGDVISDVWYDKKILMESYYYKKRIIGLCYETIKVFAARVELNGKLNFMDEFGKLFFPDFWFTGFYNIRRAVGEDGKKYEYNLLTRELLEIQETSKHQTYIEYSPGVGIWL